MNIVESINSRSVNTKFGPKDTFNITVGGVNYQLGFNKPKVKVGDAIEFVAEEDKYGMKIDPKTIRVVGSGAPTTGSPAAPAARTAYTPAARPFPIPLLHGDRAIIRQNSLTNAVKLVEAMDNTLDTSDEDVVERVIKIARMFEAYSAGDIERTAAEGE